MKRFVAIAVMWLSSGCGPATFYDADAPGAEQTGAEHAGAGPSATPASAALDPDRGWQDSNAEQIPPPISRGWPIRGGDPDSDNQRLACIEEIDISRAHMSRAIDTAKALGAYDRLKCLSEKAAFLKTLRMDLIAPGLGDAPTNVRWSCLASQGVVYEARACK